MKNIDHDKASGQPLACVFLCHKQWQKLKTKSVVPAFGHLQNFEVKSGRERWLVLDPYGLGDNFHGGMSVPFSKRLFGRNHWGESIAIDRKTGQVMKAVYYLLEPGEFNDGKGVALGLAPLSENPEHLIVPKSWRFRLDELLSQKRPFSLGLPSRALTEYIDRDISRPELRQEVVVNLQFSTESLELWKAVWRVTSNWDEG